MKTRSREIDILNCRIDLKYLSVYIRLHLLCQMLCQVGLVVQPYDLWPIAFWSSFSCFGGSCLLKVCIVIEFALATLDFVFWHNQIFISFHWTTLFFINRNPTGEETNLYRYIGWLFWHSRKKRYHSMIDWVHAWFGKFWQNKELYANCTVHIQSSLYTL